MIFENLFRNPDFPLNHTEVVFVLSLFNYLFGIHYIFSKYYTPKIKPAHVARKTYHQARYLLSEEYDRANPITRTEANQDYLEYIKSKIDIINKNYIQRWDIR